MLFWLTVTLLFRERGQQVVFKGDRGMVGQLWGGEGEIVRGE